MVNNYIYIYIYLSIIISYRCRVTLYIFFKSKNTQIITFRKNNKKYKSLYNIFNLTWRTQFQILQIPKTEHNYHKLLILWIY